jgi:peptidyl-prolyl cis-trans isomerase C
MKRFCIVAFAILALFGCSKTDNGKVLATIDSEKITMDDFNKELDKIPVNMKMLVASESGKKNFLDRLVVRKLLLKEAKKEKIDSEKDVQERLADIKDQIVIEALLKKKIITEAQISDDELKKYYEEHKEEFKRPKEINTRHILLKTEGEAKQVQAKLLKGEDFVELAKSFSIDPNAKASGGEIGFQPQGSLLPDYEKAAFNLKKAGDISGIVKTQFGYHIIRLEAVRPAAYAPFEEVKDSIKNGIVQARQGEMLEKYIDSLKKGSKISINENLLQVPEKPEAKVPPTPAPPKEEAPAKDGPAPKK